MSKRFTIKEVLQITKQYVPNRYEYMKRDVVKRVYIKQVKEVQRHDIPGKPRERIKYEIVSKSYPQYAPYYTGKDKRGRPIRYQRTISHHYDIILEIDRLSINTSNWRMRVGSGRKWEKKPPQSKVKTIYKGNRKRWSKDRQALHRKKAPYLDAGDYNSRVKGIMGDFHFRQAWAYHIHGHLYGRQYGGNIPSPITNPKNVVFFDKHQLNFINSLMNRGVLKNN